RAAALRHREEPEAQEQTGPVHGHEPGRPHPQTRPRPRGRAACSRTEARAGDVITIRPATEADVPAMSRVLTASITELCGADHGNDPDRIARWTANKNVEGVRSMLANPN